MARVTDDARAVAEWSAEVIRLHASRSRPAGGAAARLVAYPRWGATIFYRKTQEIGFAGAARLATDVVAARLRARR
jgi:hypothetical protein